MEGLLSLIAGLLRSALALFRGRGQQAIVELALRQQLAVYSQTKRKPRLRQVDRTFWIALRRLWPRWKEVLAIVKPDTVVRWHREGFRIYWRWISKRGPGRPRLAAEVRGLIRRFAAENGWGARKIPAELEKLEFRVGLATVSRYLPKRLPVHQKPQSWRTFLRNHRDGIAAMDFFTVSTVGFRVLYVWFVLAHGSRQVMHFNVTANPTAQWVVQQLREAFPEASAPVYLVHDRDSIFSKTVRDTIRSFGTEPVRTAYRSPWQNGTAERWVGTCRRELLDRVIVLNERHLHRRLREYVRLLQR
ncbi:MAG TPA: integrase [Myxococcota bacterium]|nr:integrase [Myxococcota bacterium]